MEKYYSLFPPVMSCELKTTINKLGCFPSIPRETQIPKESVPPQNNVALVPLVLDFELERNSPTSHQMHHTKLGSFIPSFEPHNQVRSWQVP